ncbi:serine protease snake-like [Teleopsis dalmanni]|uniref:serine protease snake-like n=1 Tax=Teleopsis dalmanni TaxID=139649 RepID=UPI0018CEE9B3|nr:serine protease snake-like [Teleopsis dalmanni]
MWELLWKIFIFYILICRNSATYYDNSQNGRIIYPNKEFFDDCYMDEKQQIKGKCKNLRDCPSALSRWKNENIRPKTCYFNKFEQIVCCELAFGEEGCYLSPAIARRRSELACMPELNITPAPQLHKLIPEGDNIVRTTVVHGDPTELNEFPYMVALGWTSNLDSSIIYRCGGALISKKFVLTAAHCTDLGGVTPKYARIGGINLTDSKNSDIKIKRIIVHPSYDYISSYNDIALIELEQESNNEVVCLWSKYDLPNKNVTAIGYGHTKFGGEASQQLLKANLNIVHNNLCRTHYIHDNDQLQYGIINTQICAGDPEELRDTCQGDSGGPVIMKIGEDIIHDFIVGITSFGQGCAGKPPSVNTRISAYIDWIENIVWPLSL